VRRGRETEPAQRRIQGERGDGGAFGEKTLSELSAEFGVHPTMISNWGSGGKLSSNRSTNFLAACALFRKAVKASSRFCETEFRLGSRRDANLAVWNRELAVEMNLIACQTVRAGRDRRLHQICIRVRRPMIGASCSPLLVGTLQHNLQVQEAEAAELSAIIVFLSMR
jgi:hypothetical protein